jgi:hypothetical protein
VRLDRRRYPTVPLELSTPQARGRLRMTAKHAFLAPIARDLTCLNQQALARQDITALQDQPFPPRLQRLQATTPSLVPLRQHSARLGRTTPSLACLPACHAPPGFTAMCKASQMLLWTVPLATIAPKTVQSPANVRWQRSITSPTPKASQIASNAALATTVPSKD